MIFGVRALILICLLAAPAAAAPRVAVYTMGPGEELFSTFGHAAICVESRCYNYGTADFRTPLPLTWSFIRGEARFWVSVLDVRDMLGYYASVNRAVWRQELPLEADEATRLATALEASTDERVKYYRYHHFDDNCTTRIRDLVDAALGSRLHRDPTDRRLTFRQWARAGFAESWPLQIAVELLLGRPADRRTDSWLAMFLPSELRAEVASRLHAPPVLVVPSTRPPPGGAPWLGALALALGGLLLGALVLFGRRAGLAVAGVIVGLVGLVLWSLFVLSSFPELRQNENLLIFWPSDLIAGWLPRRYLDVRLIALALVVILHVGVLVQPLWPILFVAPPFLAARFRLQSKA
jgi:hypothetical protein